MVFASTCEHASSAFIFASTSSDQKCLASSEHFKKIQIRDGEQRDLSLLKRNVLRLVIRLTLFNQSQQLTGNSTLLAMMSNYVTFLRVSFSAVHQVSTQGDPKLCNPTL